MESLKLNKLHLMRKRSQAGKLCFRFILVLFYDGFGLLSARENLLLRMFRFLLYNGKSKQRKKDGRKQKFWLARRFR